MNGSETQRMLRIASERLLETHRLPKRLLEASDEIDALTQLVIRYRSLLYMYFDGVITKKQLQQEINDLKRYEVTL